MASLAIPLITSGIQGLAGLFGARPSTTTKTGTADTNSSTNYQYTPQQTTLMNQLMQQYQSQINGTDLSGYQSQGIQDINKTSDASQQAIQNMLAQRGLSFSPAAATAQVQNRVQQNGQQSQFLNSLPLLNYQLKSQALTNAGNFVNSQKVNTSSTSHTNSQETDRGNGNMAGGLFAGIGTGIADTLGKRFANQKG